MSTTIKPTVGRVVLVFFATAASGAMEGYALPTDPNTPVPGLVTRAHSDSCINVAAFDANGENLPLTSVRLLQDGDERPTSGCWAEWMPYQKQQAEKHATEAKHLVAAEPKNTRENWAGTGLDFGTALLALKDGKRVARAGWNGKGMWLALTGKDGNWSGAIEGGAMPADWQGFLPFIGMYTADRRFVPWLASQTDVLAEDWQTVD